jgi:hypothetical protein
MSGILFFFFPHAVFAYPHCRQAYPYHDIDLEWIYPYGGHMPNVCHTMSPILTIIAISTPVYYSVVEG